jgi:hypothetical protein
MSLFSSSNKASTQNTTNNSQTGAGTNGQAIGANSSGNTISIQSTDLHAVHDALSASSDISNAALNLGKSVVADNTSLGKSVVADNTAVSLESIRQNNALARGTIDNSLSTLNSAFTQYTQLAQTGLDKVITAQNNASTAALNIAANAAPQSDASLSEHLAGSPVIPAGQEIDQGFNINGSTLKWVGIAAAVIAALYFLNKKSP